jgi:CheY-like chemotaxis protein
LLVVEDEYFIAVVIQNHLEAAGAIVSAVGSLPAAIEMIKSKPIDAAIVDINLQGVKAYAVADLLTAKNIPFVISSAYDDCIFCSRYPQVPACQKPYPFETLKNLVLSVLR